MVESVAREYGQVARNLGVEPELLLNLRRAGQLPAIKAGRRANILIADRDLVTVLRRYLLVRAAKQLNLNQSMEPVTAEVERLSEAILIYLESRYGHILSVEIVKHIADRLLPRKDSRSNYRVSRIEEERRKVLVGEIFTLLLSRKDLRPSGREMKPGSTDLANAA